MEASELNKILEQHKLWIDGKGGKCANLKDANLRRASLYCADLTRADLTRANLTRANLTGANLKDADLRGANLTGANLQDANLSGADLFRANLTNAILPDISWIIPGCLVQLNHTKYEFYLSKESKWENFTQDSFGVFIQNNETEGTFDMLIEDRIIRGIPNFVKYTGLKQIASELV